MLTEDDLHDYVNGTCFRTGPSGLVGAEAEWLVTAPALPDALVSPQRLRTLLAGAEPPRGSAISYEPGGQLELSSVPQEGPARAHDALRVDIAHVSARLAGAGLRLRGVGLDPRRGPRDQSDHPRYTAMADYFDAEGFAAGHTMMCSTASLQVCLDVGVDAADAHRRWLRTHRIGPLLVAAFANSPLWRDQPTGWRSTRWAVWAAIDSSRTRPVSCRDPVQDWAGYALDARVMAIREPVGPWTVAPGLTLREWLAGAGTRRPTRDDLAFHLSTLFPPVRPRGWLELRMVDALPDPWWAVALAVACALVDDPLAAATADAAADEFLRGADPAPAHWLIAARDGLTDPGLRRYAQTCFPAAAAALTRMGAAELAALTHDYTERYVDRGRCPADDLATAGVP